MLEITITKITGNRNKSFDELYAIEIYYAINKKYTTVLLHLKDFFRNNTKSIEHTIFSAEKILYWYSVNTETKNNFVSYLTEIVFNEKFNFILNIKESNKIRIVYTLSSI